MCREQLAKTITYRKLIRMEPIESLKIIYEPWKTRVIQDMRKESLGREFVAEELNRYYELLEKALEEKDPGWLKPILIDWAASRTETDMTADEITLAPVLNLIAESFSKWRMTLSHQTR